jgi:Xaa-Pro aminopeptidase
MNLATVQAYLADQQIDGWLLYDFRGSNPVALYVAGLTTSGSRRWFLWIPAQGEPRWLIHAIEGSTFRSVRRELAGEVLTYAGWRELEAKLATLVRSPRGSAQRIAMEYSPFNAIPYVSLVDAGMKELVERVTAAQIVSSADLVQLAQAVLSEAQIASHRRAAAVCLAAKDAAFAFLRARLSSGETTTEYAVQQFIVDFLRARGMEFDHPAIVAVNGNAADPHYAPTEETHAPIGPGDMVLIDLWARETRTPLDCYADITWCAYCGAEPPAKAREIFSVVAQGRDAAVRFMQERLAAGEPLHGYEVDDVCRGVIAAAGYGDAFFHRTGHSLGVTTHYNGVNIDNLETQDRRRLIPSVLFTIEPGIYLPGFDFDDSGRHLGLGIRSEINCLATERGIETTTLPLQTEMIALMA